MIIPPDSSSYHGNVAYPETMYQEHVDIASTSLQREPSLNLGNGTKRKALFRPYALEPKPKQSRIEITNAHYHLVLRQAINAEIMRLLILDSKENRKPAVNNNIEHLGKHYTIQ